MRLSLCIATWNRAAFLGHTLDAIVPQLTPDVELVVVDGGSSDGTADLMARYVARGPGIVYRREQENGGVDRDFDKAVAYARGEYCWLLSDDDIVVPGAVEKVLQSLADGPELLVVNSEIRNKDLSVVLKARQLEIDKDMRYDAAQAEAFFATAGSYLSFIGAVVIRRDRWLARAREPYYGSLFIHVGVIFQSPVLDSVKLMAAPVIRIRYGNAMWTARGYDIWTRMWPSLVWSFEHFSPAARRRVSIEHPARRLKTLLWFRAIGAFAPAQLGRAPGGPPGGAPFARAVAALPAGLVNSLLALYCYASAHGDARMKLYELSMARCAGRLTRWLARRSRFPETER